MNAVVHAAAAIDCLPPARLGTLLEARRERAGVAAPAAVRAAKIDMAALKDIEAGRTAPEPTVLAALLQCYGVEPSEFVPPRAPLVTTRFDDSGDRALRAFVDTVRAWRKSDGTGKMSFRADDIAALGKLLGSDPDEIERRLIALTGCSRREARALRKWLLAAVVALPLAVGLMGSVAPSAAAATHASSVSSATVGSAATVAQGIVRPGSLSLTVAAPKLGPVQADGSIALSESYVVTDARGSGGGWSVQATFDSVDAVAQPVGETLTNVNGGPNLPQTPGLPASLSGAPAVIASAAPGAQGMGRFSGEIDLNVVNVSRHTERSSGDLTLTFAPRVSA